MPSFSAWRKASSRFGPTMPFVPARASVWQEPHFATNSCLPLTVLSSERTASWPQPAAAAITAAPSATTAVRNDTTLLIAAAPYRSVRSGGNREVVQPTGRPGEHVLGDPDPRELRPRRRHKRVPRARAHLRVGLQPPDQASGDRLHRAVIDRKREQRRRLAGHGRREHLGDLG